MKKRCLADEVAAYSEILKQPPHIWARVDSKEHDIDQYFYRFILQDLEKNFYYVFTDGRILTIVEKKISLFPYRVWQFSLKRTSSISWK